MKDKLIGLIDTHSNVLEDYAKVMSYTRKECGLGVQGGVSTDLIILATLIDSKPACIFEFSSGQLNSTFSLSMACKYLGLDTTIHSVEIDIHRYYRCFINKEKFNLDNVKLYHLDVWDFDFKSVEPIDFLFVDADHSQLFAEKYIQSIFPKVKPGGYIYVHDVFSSPDGKIDHLNGESVALANYLESRDIPSYCTWDLVKDPFVYNTLDINADMPSGHHNGPCHVLFNYQDVV